MKVTHGQNSWLPNHPTTFYCYRCCWSRLPLLRLYWKCYKRAFLPNACFRDHVGSLKFAIVEVGIYTTKTGRRSKAGFDVLFCCLSGLKKVVEKESIQQMKSPSVLCVYSHGDKRKIGATRGPIAPHTARPRRCQRSGLGPSLRSEVVPPCFTSIALTPGAMEPVLMCLFAIC